MKVGTSSYRSIWFEPDRPDRVLVIDQRKLPHRFEILSLHSSEDARHAIADMVVRGAPLIGATAAFGMYLAARGKEPLDAAYQSLLSSRPTAVNLRWALDRQWALLAAGPEIPTEALLDEALWISEEDIRVSRGIGDHGLPLLEAVHREHPDRPVQILTHCNAGWLATVDWGTATSPIYLAHDRGIPVHVWVDETRPRNQGASLTAWELGEHGVPHTVIPDNAGGHLMQHRKVDLVITGTDRTTRRGDVCNKIGTYLKALAADHNGVPFYVALPSSTIDWTLSDGMKEIPIEERSGDEVSTVTGRDGDDVRTVTIVPDGTAVANFAFDVTPAGLVSGLITERGVSDATEEGLTRMFPDQFE